MCGGRPHIYNRPLRTQAETQPRSSGPSQTASILPHPTACEKDLSLKIIVTTAQQTIQRGHYVPRERPRCWCYQKRQQRSVPSRLGAAHVLQPRPSHPDAHAHPSAHSQTHPRVPIRHMLRHKGALGCAQLPFPHLPPPPRHTSVHPLPALYPHCQPHT